MSRLLTGRRSGAWKKEEQRRPAVKSSERAEAEQARRRNPHAAKLSDQEGESERSGSISAGEEGEARIEGSR